MRTIGVSSRFLLAALVAVWGPLWCCCGFGKLAHAATVSGSAAASASSTAREHHRHCHQSKSDASHCHQTKGESDQGGGPVAPGKCDCTHHAGDATLTSAGDNSLNLGPILPIAAFDFPGAGFVAALIDDHPHFDPRNTTGPPVLQGASAQTFFCHFIL